MLILEPDDPRAVAVIDAIHRGDVDAVQSMLRAEPALATARIGDPGPHALRESRTLLHVATDWPGNYPNSAVVIAALATAGADVNARFTGPHTETPLHWAASSDDVAALDALLDHGADIDSPGAVIGDGDGTPLTDAVAFGQWNAARRLVERGATTNLWQAAALGLLDRVAAMLGRGQALGPYDISQAFWCACHGGQQDTAALLLNHGADINWLGYDYLTPLGAARRANATSLVHWLEARGGRMSPV